MNKEEVQAALNDLKVRQDLFLLSKLEGEYNDLSDKCNKLYTFIYSLDFKEKVPDSNEQCLLQEQHKRMEAYRTNLYQRIDFYRCRVKREEGIKDWSQYKKTDSTYIGVDVSNEGSHSECCQVCGDDIATHHCGQDVRVRYDPNESQPVNVPVKGDDFDDACCQAREKRPVDDGSAAVNEAQVPNSIKSLVGMLVVDAFHDIHKCTCCEYQKHCNAKKVEIVGGYFLCLEELPNSIVTE